MIGNTVTMIDMHELDELVMKTYGKTYNFQQQDGCKDRGTHEITVPVKYPEDYENDTVPEEVNHDDMGVSFKAWLARDPKQLLDSPDEWERKNGITMWWDRNFYPHIDMVMNDLHSKGLVQAGDCIINIDW